MLYTHRTVQLNSVVCLFENVSIWNLIFLVQPLVLRWIFGQQESFAVSKKFLHWQNGKCLHLGSINIDRIGHWESFRWIEKYYRWGVCIQYHSYTSQNRTYSQATAMFNIQCQWILCATFPFGFVFSLFFFSSIFEMTESGKCFTFKWKHTMKFNCVLGIFLVCFCLDIMFFLSILLSQRTKRATVVHNVYTSLII